MLGLSISINLNAQHRKQPKKKTSHESAAKKKSGTSHHNSGSGKKQKSKSGNKKQSSSGGSHIKKSKKETIKHKKGRGKRHSRHGHVYIDNDERDTEETAAIVPTEPVNDNSALRQAFQNPPDAAKPWMLWYWVQNTVSREGITAGMEAMKEAGIGGTYLVNISQADKLPSSGSSTAIQDMMRFAVTESGRLGLSLTIAPDKADVITPNLVWGRAFNSIHDNWDIYPGKLKAICDSQMAKGINRLILNKFVADPLPNNGLVMATDSPGVYFRKNQTWWKQSFALMRYLQRCQAVLQMGKAAPVDTGRTANDLLATDSTLKRAEKIAWTHRAGPEFDVYFIANQQSVQRKITLSLKIADKIPEMWDPMTGETYQCSEYTCENGRTNLTLLLEPNGSFFIVLRKPVHSSSRKGKNWSDLKTARSVDGVWQVSFDPKKGGPDGPVVFTALTDWTKNEIPGIKYYSGTADYMQVIKWNNNLTGHRQIWLDLGSVANIADITVNGIYCGTAWTPPYRVDVTKAFKTGYNKVHVEVSNTWANRLTWDLSLPEDKRINRTVAPYRPDNISLLPAGLLGPVRIITVDRTKRD